MRIRINYKQQSEPLRFLQFEPHASKSLLVVEVKGTFLTNTVSIPNTDVYRTTITTAVIPMKGKSKSQYKQQTATHITFNFYFFLVSGTPVYSSCVIIDGFFLVYEYCCASSNAISCSHTGFTRAIYCMYSQNIEPLVDTHKRLGHPFPNLIGILDRNKIF